MVRVAVDAPKDVEALAEIRRQTTANLVVDLQENYRLAEQVAPHVDKIRYNPGHLYHHEKDKPVAREGAVPGGRGGRDHDCALRVGVNCGSVDPETKARHPEDDTAAVVESALEHCRLLDDLGFTRYVVSIKDSHPRKVIEANQRFAALRPDVPLHLGVTEAGIPPEGIVKTRVAFEQLLSRGIGDTLRVSLTLPNPRKHEEIAVGRQILAGHRRRALPFGAGLRRRPAQHHLVPVLLPRREREVRGAGGGGEGDDGVRRGARRHHRGHGLPGQRTG